MVNIDNTLETFVNADYETAKFMQRLRKLAKREYKLENYGECSRRCIQWMKLYAVMLPSYVKYADIFTTVTLNTKPLNNPDYRFNYIINQLRDSKFKNALYWYTECPKYLVGANVYCLIEKINGILPKHERYEAFLTYSDIVEADGGLHNNEEHYLFMCETREILNKAKKLNEQISLNRVCEVLKNIKINPRYVKNSITNIKQLENIQSNTCIEDNSKKQNLIGMRLTKDNAQEGMIITYSTKKGKEWAKITKVCDDYVETIRLKNDKNGDFISHNVPICKISQNKPAYTRIITIVK